MKTKWFVYGGILLLFYSLIGYALSLSYSHLLYLGDLGRYLYIGIILLPVFSIISGLYGEMVLKNLIIASLLNAFTNFSTLTIVYSLPIYLKSSMSLLNKLMVTISITLAVFLTTLIMGTLLSFICRKIKPHLNQVAKKIFIVCFLIVGIFFVYNSTENLFPRDIKELKVSMTNTKGIPLITKGEIGNQYYVYFHEPDTNTRLSLKINKDDYNSLNGHTIYYISYEKNYFDRHQGIIKSVKLHSSSEEFFSNSIM